MLRQRNRRIYSGSGWSISSYHVDFTWKGCGSLACPWNIYIRRIFLANWSKSRKIWRFICVVLGRIWAPLPANWSGHLKVLYFRVFFMCLLFAFILCLIDSFVWSSALFPLFVCYVLCWIILYFSTCSFSVSLNLSIILLNWEIRCPVLKSALTRAIKTAQEMLLG